MKNIKKNNYEFNFQKKALVTVMTTLLTTVMTTGIAQASDIDLYQAAKSGDITLMLMLDISGSMDTRSISIDYSLSGCTISKDTAPGGYQRSYCSVKSSSASSIVKNTVTGCTLSGTSYRCYDRISRLKDGVFDLLRGNSDKRITRLDDDKIIGLSTLGVYVNNNYYNTGSVLVPARPLGEQVSGGQTQRDQLLNAVAGLSASTNTPTARSLAETVAYLLGTTTAGVANSGFAYSANTTKNSARTAYQSPASLDQSADIQQCSGQGIYVLTDGEPTQDTNSRELIRSALGNNGNNFTCSGTNSNSTPSSSWDCIFRLNTALVNPDNNPKGLKFKTAVVGFGNAFNGVSSYDKSKTQAENIQALGSLNSDVKSAAYWGIIGEGGWYSGSSSRDIVDSVNEFINSLGTDIPPVSTGSPTIPNDALYPAQLQNFAYYPQFDPTPDKSYQLWAGNLKKYAVSSAGQLVDKSANAIVESSGKIKENFDLWSPSISDIDAIKNADENTMGSSKRASIGGVKSQLLLNFAQNSTTENRKLLTNRIGTAGSTSFAGGTTLRQVKASDITDSIYKNDPNRGYLLTLLGFSGLDVANPENITSTILQQAPELRQVGGVMHSSPLLLTNQGNITSQNNVITTQNRKDYVLFGSTQGLLHVVDAITGKEKFAFMPNEMVEKQKQASLKYDTTNGGTNNLFYGVDGPWTAYTEYVVGNNRILTVGKGNNNQEGKQLVYGGLRMGGKSYYSLDLQNIDSPSLKFQIDPENQKVHYNNSSKSFTQLQYMGQSWSKPKIAWVRWNGERKMVMFVGGGYDMGYESDAYTQTNAVGAGIYMFDALNGDLLWWTGKNATDTTTGVIGVNHDDMKYSVVSEIRDVDSDSDGLVDNVYFGDLGGQVWRVDFDNGVKTATSKFSKKPVRLLNLNKGSESPRFYDMPAFSIYTTNGTRFAVISVGSGNRSKPLAEYTVNATSYDYDATYNVYDKDVARSDLLATSSYSTKDIGLTGAFALKEIDNTTRFIQNTPIAPYTTTGGWFYKFKSNKIQSAKVFGTPLVMNRKMYVSYFDASKPGLSGDCGAGVKGESFLSTFCMPYGQCVRSTSGNSGSGGDPSVITDDIPLGAGIQTPTTGNGCQDGENCSKVENDEDVSDCLSSGSRVLITPQGGAGGAKTEVCLTPLKWYEKLK